jgi:CO dehydrogenase/acetyl-CoA synthase gamma subunit (corrinoid Fe-S protein)
MTQEKFDEINDHFNSLIGENDLLDGMTVIDGESIISRVYKKCNGKIESDVLAVIMLYNKHIVDEQYEAADKLKTLILNSY